MSQALRRMTLDEFDDWQPHQDVRCQLVEGLIYAMTGATIAHDIVVANLSAALLNQLRAKGSLCRPFSANVGVITGPATLRRPDVTILCPPFDRKATRSSQPTLLAEVLSPSTEGIDQAAKMFEYRALPSLRTYLLLAPDRIDIGVWQREADESWRYTHIVDQQTATIELADLGVTIAISDIYAGAEVTTAPRPRLVWPDEPPDR